MLMETIIRDAVVEHTDLDCPVIGGSHSVEFCAFPGSHELEYDRAEERLHDVARVGLLSQDALSA
jgi:hypothetical protein